MSQPAVETTSSRIINESDGVTRAETNLSSCSAYYQVLDQYKPQESRA